MSPVNEYVGPLLEAAFSNFVEGGFVEFAYGGKEVGHACKIRCRAMLGNVAQPIGSHGL